VISLFLILAVVAALTSCNQPSEKQENTKVNKIILFIGDGMGLNEVFAAMASNHDSLCIDRADQVSFQKNQPVKDYITDSAASGTALATGSKTTNGRIGQDSAGIALESILKVAEKHGYATGLVATSAITHATPASFIANQPVRDMYEAIAADFLKTDIDVFIGGGYAHFTARADSLNLADSLRARCYKVVYGLDSIMNLHSGKLAGFTAQVHNPPVNQGRGDMLLRSTQKAVELLDQNDKGFFLMVEGSQIDWGGHANDASYVISETLDLNKVVEWALDYAAADGHTLIILTADHETGGMIVLDVDPATREVKTTFTTGDHTPQMIPVYAFGPGSEYFTGVYQNSDIKKKMMQAYGWTE
ncbi:MAG: alkaline phosphatase, partial [Bacteroidota bacterium]